MSDDTDTLPPAQHQEMIVEDDVSIGKSADAASGDEQESTDSANPPDAERAVPVVYAESSDDNVASSDGEGDAPTNKEEARYLKYDRDDDDDFVPDSDDSGSDDANAPDYSEAASESDDPLAASDDDEEDESDLGPDDEEDEEEEEEDTADIADSVSIDDEEAPAVVIDLDADDAPAYAPQAGAAKKQKTGKQPPATTKHANDDKKAKKQKKREEKEQRRAERRKRKEAKRAAKRPRDEDDPVDDLAEHPAPKRQRVAEDMS